MLDAPGLLWLVIFLVSYEVTKAAVTWLFRRRASSQESKP